MRLLYFAWVRERIGVGEETRDIPPTVATVSDLLDWLGDEDETYRGAFSDRSRLRAAVDQAMVTLDTPIADSREVAIFPPVTGG